jgi:hypothetical protein
MTGKINIIFIFQELLDLLNSVLSYPIIQFT